MPENPESSTIETNVNVPLNKGRLEALTDGVFAIVMTLLVIDIKVPEMASQTLSAYDLFQEITKLAPLLISYFVSFAVLAWIWLSHHFLFHYHAKTINRVLVLLNFLFLFFVALIPFSTYLLGSFYNNITSTIFYGINIMLVTIMTLVMYKYAWRSDEIENGTVSSRVKKQSQIRMYITLGFTSLGIIFSFVYTPLSYFLYAFPIVFNVVPGLLNLSERIFGFELK
jgi:uncharacterized membrane protein